MWVLRDDEILEVTKDLSRFKTPYNERAVAKRQLANLVPILKRGLEYLVEYREVGIGIIGTFHCLDLETYIDTLQSLLLEAEGKPAKEHYDYCSK